MLNFCWSDGFVDNLLAHLWVCDVSLFLFITYLIAAKYTTRRSLLCLVSNQVFGFSFTLLLRFECLKGAISTVVIRSL